MKLKCLLPKSLAGQMIALTLMAIVVAQVIGFAIFADERRFALQSAAHKLLADAMQPQYEFVMSKFGAVPPRWQENMKGPVQ